MVVSLASAILFFRIILDGTNALEKKMVHALFNTSIRFYESNPSGRILNRASRDQQVVDEILPTTLFDSVQSLLMSIGSITVVGVINPWIFLVLIPFIGFYFVLRHIYARSNHQLKRLESVTRSPVYSLLASSLNGLMTIRALKKQDYFIKSFHDRIDANTRSYINMIGVSQWFDLCRRCSQQHFHSHCYLTLFDLKRSVKSFIISSSFKLYDHYTSIYAA